MAHESPEIHTKLVLDDHASHAFEHIKEGIHHLNHEFGEATEHLLEFGKEIVGHAFGHILGLELERGVEGFKEFGEEAIHAAMDAETETRSIAGVLAMHDKFGRSMDQLIGTAEEMHDQFADLAVEAGSSTKAIVDAFTDISERSQASSEENRELLDKMVQAGKTVPGGLSEITMGYQQMEAGMVRAKNPLVGLIVANHLLKGSAREVAKEMMKMTPEKQMEIAQKAIEAAAGKAGNVKLTGSQMLQSLKTMHEVMLEGLGDALLKGFQKPYAFLKQMWEENEAKLGPIWEMVGEAVGKKVEEGMELAKEGIDYIKEHGSEIKADIKEAWDYAKSIFDFIIGHRKEIMFGLGALSLAHVAPTAVGMAGSVAGGIGTGGSALFGALKFLGTADVPKFSLSLDGLRKTTHLTGEVIDGLMTGTAGLSKEATALTQTITATTKGLGAMALAVGAVYLAADQFMKMRAESEDMASTYKDNFKTIQQLAEEGNSDRLKIALETEKSLGHINDAFAKSMQELADQADWRFDQVKKQADEGLSGVNAGLIDPLEEMATAYRAAGQFHNEAARHYAAQILLASGTTAEAVKTMGGDLGGSLEDFAKLFEGAGDDIQAKLKHFMGKDTELKAPKVTQVFTGDISIHQDFRDENPNRIMAMFRRDLMKSAEHRTTSRLGTAFGL